MFVESFSGAATDQIHSIVGRQVEESRPTHSGMDKMHLTQ